MISVCIATFNGENFIKKQLESILNQTVPVDEVIICDDCSTDNTAKIVTSFINDNALSKSWQFFQNQKNIGYCLNFYRCIFKAKGNYIFLCDQDDIWLDNKVEVMSRFLQKNSEILVLASRYQLIDQNDKDINNLSIPYYSLLDDSSFQTIDTNQLIGCSCIRGFSICFNAKIKEFLKPIDLKSLLAHDWYISIIGSLLGKTVVLNRVLCKYRFHGGNVSLSDINRKELLGSFEKRITGLEESIKAHSYLLGCNIKNKPYWALKRFIKFEKKRLKFLKTKNFLLFLTLVFYLGEYKRYYKSLKGAFRVFIGDFCYCYNINFKIKK